MPAPDELSLFVVRLEAIGAPYMVTGATAAILYGQPRVTNDLDVVLSLDDDSRAALPLRRRLRWSENLELAVAPPEYVVLRKLEFFREGGSAKHPSDIRAIRDVTGVNEIALAPWLERMGLAPLWEEIKAAP